MQTNPEKNKRLGYPPSEYARLNGRHPSWAYRQLYAGKVKAITSLGRILIPASEVERVMAEAKPYEPKARKRKAKETIGKEATL
jgi:hypothetical protein